MELVDAEEELVRWPYEYQFFIRDCGVLYISLARISTVAPSFRLLGAEKEEHVPCSSLVSDFFRQPLFQQCTSPVLAIVTDSHVYETAGAYEDVGRGGACIHCVQQLSVQ